MAATPTQLLPLFEQLLLIGIGPHLEFGSHIVARSVGQVSWLGITAGIAGSTGVAAVVEYDEVDCQGSAQNVG